MRYLITGGAGFIGSHLCRKLIEFGGEVLCVDNLYTGKKSNTQELFENKKFEFLRHDITFPLYLEIDENDYEILLQKKLEENFSRPVSDVIASAIFNHNKLKLETKIVEKLLKDFKTRAQVEKLRKKKRELTNLQRQCSTEEESFELLNKILEVEKQLRDIKYKS